MGNSTWICFFPLVYTPPLGFSIYSLKHCTGYSIHSMNGMSLTISMIFYLSFLPTQTCLRTLFNSIKFCLHLGCQKPLKRIPMVVLSFILDLSSIPTRWKSLSLPTKNNARSTPSVFSYHPHRYHSPFSRRPLVFCLTAVKLFLLDVHSYTIFSLSSIMAISSVTTTEFGYPMLQKLTSNGGSIFSLPGSQSQ